MGIEFVEVYDCVVCEWKRDFFGYLNQVTEHHNYLLRDKRDDKRVGFYRHPLFDD